VSFVRTGFLLFFGEPKTIVVILSRQTPWPEVARSSLVCGSSRLLNADNSFLIRYWIYAVRPHGTESTEPKNREKRKETIHLRTEFVYLCDSSGILHAPYSVRSQAIPVCTRSLMSSDPCAAQIIKNRQQ
jgi:hypothetical protein